MAIANTLRVDVRATNFALSLFDDQILMRKVFPKNITVPSIDTWYPIYDAKAYAQRDLRNQLRKGVNTIPKKVSLEYTRTPIVIEGYEDYDQKRELEIGELNAMGINKVKDDMIRGCSQIAHKCVDLDLIDLLQNTGLWNNGAATTAAFGGFVFSNLANADPEMAMRRMRILIQTQSNGISPNTIIAGTQVLDNIFMNAKIKTRYDNVTGDMGQKKKWLFDLIGIPSNRVYEIKTCTNTAAKGATKSMAQYVGNYLWMGYIEPNPTQDKPTSLACIAVKGFTGNDEGIRVFTATALNGNKFADKTDGILTIIEKLVAVKQISKELGYLLNTNA